MAAPDGDDEASGSVDQPLLTAQRLVERLGIGQTGCLREGRYATDDEIRFELPSTTLRSYPGERASLAGRLYVTDTADDTTIAGLEIDGRNSRDLPSPTINAARVRVIGNDISNHHTAICIVVGSSRYGRAEDTLIAGNVIHDCGTEPSTNFEHGIYVSAADGTLIQNNVIRDNADRGIQMYPDGQGSIIKGNLIERNGEGVLFGGDREVASSGNLVEGNVIVDSRLRYNVESNWVGPVGSGNVVRDNCIGGGARDDGSGGRGIGEQTGFSVVEDGDPAEPPCKLPAGLPAAAAGGS